MCYVYFSMWKFQIIYFYNMYTLSPFWGLFFSWRHTRTILGRPIWICYLTDHANSRFFFNFRFFFIVLGVLNDGLFSEGKYAVCFTLLLKRLKFRGCEKNQHRLKYSLHLGGALCVDVPPNTKTLIDSKPTANERIRCTKQIIM